MATEEVLARLRNYSGVDIQIAAEAAEEIDRLRTERDDWLNAAVAYRCGWKERGDRIYDRLVNGIDKS